MTNLWPDDIGNVQIKPPVAILKEQASLLGGKTQNLVTASVRSLVVVDIPNAFRHIFVLEAPALAHYVYTLFSITHSIQFYPLKFELDEDILSEISPNGETVTANSEAELLNILKQIFASRKTRQVIDAILAQSMAYQYD